MLNSLQNIDTETITLKYTESVKEKLMKFLESFSKKTKFQSLKIDANFEAAKAELHQDYKALKNGETEFMSLEEFEKEMIM
ncbi:MAG: hypothetical protein J0L47_02920 [Flavobacteriales bacterium]|jgi:hypothetical protein|nr:hypothetical protein [Flavobacteriales bacterium]MCA0390517.1 hypothetical protein [Bacteroidota bacterium]